MIKRIVIERLLIFFIGIPAIIIMVLFLPFCRNLIMNIVTIFFSAIGALEFSAMLEKKQIRVSKIESVILGMLAPVASTLTVSLNFPGWTGPALIMAGAGWALISGVFSRASGIESAINRLAGYFSVMIYPGVFMYWLVKMNAWEKPEAVLLFLFIAFGNDSVAWLAGTLFGANNRGIIPVSPNKSIAGFIGGLIGSTVVTAGAALLFPFVFSGLSGCVSYGKLLFWAIILGFCTGIAATLGDLAESAIKRSCDFKDSGKLMMGRGGVLDSIDSIAVAAPVFYLLYNLLFLRF